MSRAVRWMVTGAAAAVTFGLCLWLAMAVKLPFLPTTERDGWVVAAAFATAIAGFVVAGGGWWAGRESGARSADGGAGSVGQQNTGSPGSIQAGRDAKVKMRNVTFVNPPPTPNLGGDEVGPPKA